MGSAEGGPKYNLILSFFKKSPSFFPFPLISRLSPRAKREGERETEERKEGGFCSVEKRGKKYLDTYIYNRYFISLERGELYLCFFSFC